MDQEQAKALADELSTLSKLQSKALQTAAYVRMSETEAKKYDERRERISDICTLLGKFQPSESPNPSKI
jgi:hypothetical protein